MMNAYRAAASLLPVQLCGQLLVMDEYIRNHAEEIRLRTGYSVTVLADGIEAEAAPQYNVSPDDIESVLEKATCASVHSVESELTQGYISVDGGIRIGVCGTGIIKDGRLRGLKELSSLAIRIPHDVDGCSTDMYEQINRNGIKNVLIISPPGFGKTTFLRDYIRCLSRNGIRVAVADERRELASMAGGEPQFCLGRFSDVLSGIPKAEAAMLLLRTMNPQVIAMDEISRQEDIAAVCSATGCGVKLIASAHASGVDGLTERGLYRKLLSEGIFDVAVTIRKENGKRTYTCEDLK